MRLHRSFFILLLAAAALRGQTQVSLGETSGSNSSTCSLNAGQTCTLTALVTGLSDRSVTFSLNPSVGSLGTSSQNATTFITTVVYTAPSTISTKQNVTVTARAADGTTASQLITLNPFSPTITIQVTPANMTLNSGQSQQFTATILGTSSTGVTWSLGAAVGTISATGLYTAPSPITTTQKISVIATATFDTTITGAASVTLQAPTTTLQVGDGAPTSTLQVAFINAYNSSLAGLVTLPPLGQVKAFGSAGYVQEFADLANPSLKDALMTSSPTISGSQPVIRMMGLLYAYYTSIGSGTAGYPLGDSLGCPGANPCQWDSFDKSYALFSYNTALATGQNFSVSGAIYTEWNTLFGISTIGPPVSASTNITAYTTTTATEQDFANGAIFSITSGTYKGKTFGVVQPLYDLYVSQSGASGTLGLPVGDATQATTGVYKQTFEGGVLQYTSSGGGTVQLPVKSVALTGAPASTTLNLGDTVTLTAVLLGTDGSTLTDRPVSWSTTNSRVLTVQATGAAAVITAVGGGSASVIAASQGVSSPKLSFLVIAPCCSVGEGAPLAVQQAFQDALTRNQVTVQIPVQSPAARVSSGYVQMVQGTTGGSPSVYMLAQSDRLGTAYVVTGALLSKYQSLGGPAGDLGYPASDASAGGTQLFSNSAALGGNPVRVVSGIILTKWSQTGRETGAAGLPISDAAAFSTFGANSGVMQGFGKGAIYGATVGPRADQAYFAGGLILARYNALGGPSGDFGMPVSDEFVTASLHQQNFEGGNITYSTGDGGAVEHAAPKSPGIVSPGSISAGARARLAVIGFPNNSTVKVSVTGQADFTVPAANGSYTWEMFIPLAAKSAVLNIHAADVAGTSSADGRLTIKGFADNRVQLAKLQGDNQTGPPGALLPVTLKIALLDSTGAAVIGAPVTFTASGGAQVSPASAVTDATGSAETALRLPAAEGIAAVAVDSPSIAQNPVTFFARVAGSSLSNFPKLSQAGDTAIGSGTATIAQKGALLTAVAMVLRYRQNRGELAAPNGLADAAALNQFLKSDCTVDVKGTQICDGFLSGPSGEQIVNLWRAADYTGGLDVTPQPATVAAIADLLAQGSPPVVSLGLSLNGSPVGGHFVVATGVAADGSIVIQDPNPYFGRTSLSDYLNGFTVQGATWKADLRGVAQFALRSPSGTRFLMGALSQPAPVMANLVLAAQSAAGTCGSTWEQWDSVDGSGSGPSGGALVSRILVCDGLQAAYQLSVGTSQPYKAFVTDLASAGSTFDVSGSVAQTYKATRPKLNLALVPQDVSFTADSVVNAATFSEGIAPGGIVSIFGTGLAGAGTATTVDFDGTVAVILSASPFQVNAQVPAGVAPGTRNLHIRSAYGDATQPVRVSAVAPAIFLIGDPLVGAVVNQNNTLNLPSNPLTRGQALVIYATGLGAVTRQGQLSVASTPVTVVLNGQELPVLFAGLTPGYVGLYQVNVVIPASMPPGLGVPLSLKQGGVLGNTIGISLQ